jgi:AcrR family transcriptional regulator
VNTASQLRGEVPVGAVCSGPPSKVLCLGESDNTRERRMKKKAETKPRRDAGRARGEFITKLVFEHTLQELAVSGLEGLSVERIAAAAELNKTSVYRRWPTKEALVVAALEGVFANVSMQMVDTGSLRGDLLVIVSQVAAMLEQPIGRALFRAAAAESSASAVAAMASRHLASNSARPIVELANRARSRGEWRAAVSEQVLVGALIGAAIHRALLEHAPMDAPWLDSIVDLIVYGASPRDTK